MRGHSPASANCNAPAGSQTRGTSMGGLYVAATLQALLFMRYFWICLFYFLFFESSARKSFDGLTSYQLHLTCCFPLSSDFKPGVSVPFASVNLAVWSSCMILAPGARRPGFNSQNSPCFFYREMLQEASGTSFKRACLDACFASPRFFFHDVLLQSSSHAMLACTSAFLVARAAG